MKNSVTLSILLKLSCLSCACWSRTMHFAYGRTARILPPANGQTFLTQMEILNGGEL